MSAITGIILRAKRPQSEVAAFVGQMLDTMPHRGPDGRGLWAGERVGLGHLALHSTPESLHETFPLRRGPYVLTADARLDNRAELLATLGDEQCPHDSITDGELLLRAYDQWGEECGAHLLGDWAFAVWDERENRLFASRDPFGVRPFYYHAGPQGFAFATELKALLALPFVPRRLNELRLAEHLAVTFADHTSTFFDGIERLAPAHLLTTDGADFRTHRYYALDPEKTLPPQSDADYAAGLRDVFFEAVRARMRTTPRDDALSVAALLSGGLDSSSVACVARAVLGEGASAGGTVPDLPSFSAVLPSVPSSDERPYIETVLSGGGFAPHFVRGDQTGPLTDIDRVLFHEDEPFFAPGLFLSWSLFRAVSESGARVLLDGHGGDEVISFGEGYLTELARDGRWRELWGHMRAASLLFDEPMGRAFWTYFRTFRLAPAAHHSFPARAVMRLTDRALARSAPPESPKALFDGLLLAPEFAQKMQFAERVRELSAARPPGSFGRQQTARATHVATLNEPLQTFAIEVIGRAAAAHQLDWRLPFWDRRVIEYCLALPADQKASRRWTRPLLRSSMDGLLPPSIQWRTTKNDFAPNFLRGLLQCEPDRLRDLLTDDLNACRAFIDVDGVREAWKNLQNAATREHSDSAVLDASLVWQAAQTVLWLKKNNFT